MHAAALLFGPMLEISDLTYRIAGRPLFDGATAFIADGWKVGLVGRNGTGKSTLLKLIKDEVGKAGSSIRITRGARMGFVAQEVAPADDKLLDVVLAADEERAALLLEAETAQDPHRIADIYTRLSDIDAYSAEARAAEILTGLGFSQDDLSRATREFSGGWRMRAALAGVLFSLPDLLILDEPTNYLDLEGAAWLENYLRRYPHTVIVVSHDREMLNRSVTHILALADLKLEVHPGGYDTYLRKRAERASLLVGQKAKQDAERARLQAFVDRFKAKASKARQAQSRVKMLEKMQDITVPIEDRAAPFHFGDPQEMADPLLVLEHADLGYEAGKPILKDVSFRLDHDDRIVIIGPNGQGKTTLVKSIGAKLALLSGKRIANKNVRVGYFSQDQLDELRGGETVLQHIRDLEPDKGQAQHRALAARFGFGHEKVETNVEKLSGGEKVRLLLGLMSHSKPHVLILDEPTSHLDIDSREALIHAINEYSGAVLLITHDVYLAEACADRLWLVYGGRARNYDGDLNDYRKLVLDADRPNESGPGHKSGKSAEADAARQAAAQPAAPAKPDGPRKNPTTLRHRAKKAEEAMNEVQSLIAKVDGQLSAPGLFERDPAKGAALSKQRAELDVKLSTAEEEWLAAQAEMEAEGVRA
ncbi:MAG: ABC-F family ATP-binding cassette domain-containing protein [Caulobacterales bacterium]